MSEVKLIEGDCLDVLKSMPDKSVDAVICDPPYGLEFMGKEWDSPSKLWSKRKPEENEHLRSSEYGGGYKNILKCPKKYEAGISFQKWTQSWATEALRVLKPGGYLLAFGGTRTYHRLTCGLEDAGFVIKDTLCWLYGSGFPKSMNIGKAFDKAAGVEREVVGEHPYTTQNIKGNAYNSESSKQRQRLRTTITTPTTALAKTWDGYGTALKPAHEPIVLAQKPLDGTYCQSLEKWGCGALNIDACRIKVNPDIDDMLRKTSRKKRQTDTWETGSGFKNEKNNLTGVRPAGRFPANLILDEAAAWRLDGKSGILKSGSDCIRRKEGTFLEHGGLGKAGDVQITYGDQGGPSRFFYVAKASSQERGKGNDHPTVKPIAIMMYLARLILPHHKPVVWLDPFLGSGTSALAAAKLNDEEHYQISFIGIDDKEKYLEIAKQRLAEYNKSVQLRIPLRPPEPVRQP